MVKLYLAINFLSSTSYPLIKCLIKKLTHAESHTFLLETTICSSTVLEHQITTVGIYKMFCSSFIFELLLLRFLCFKGRRAFKAHQKVVALTWPRLYKNVFYAGSLDWEKLLVTGTWISSWVSFLSHCQKTNPRTSQAKQLLVSTESWTITWSFFCIL